MRLISCEFEVWTGTECVKKKGGLHVISVVRFVWDSYSYSDSFKRHTVTGLNNGYIFYVPYALIWTKTAYPCGAADTEQRTQFTFSGYYPKWRYADAEETNVE